MIIIIYKWDGDIYRFSGDAFTAFFLDKKDLSASKRAINASISYSQTRIKNIPLKIKVHIGISKGRVYFQDLKDNFIHSIKICKQFD
ncbi:MAG: hypothetical protein ABDH37_05750 [Candidatus Hydrothermales bacterium]